MSLDISDIMLCSGFENCREIISYLQGYALLAQLRFRYSVVFKGSYWGRSFKDQGHTVHALGKKVLHSLSDDQLPVPDNAHTIADCLDLG